ncbi:hypothetical protein [Paenibacillus arenosi]|uniref:ResB-like domain-containing protein n=1 Tax=Paenibacillus arenosi TaxID=2774142 RepID=A0ABR9B6K4_9BACL|nr:hypothetical protein [Paenibacillus arenosi]MBD8501080.1 hypothetical protein [Paenibacillus arenosi]
MKYSLIGLVLIVFAGFLHTLERVAARIGSYIAVIGQQGGYDTRLVYPSIADNLFVLLSLIGGLILLFISLLQKKSTKSKLSTPSYIMFSHNQGVDDEVHIIIGKTDKRAEVADTLCSNC